VWWRQYAEPEAPSAGADPVAVAVLGAGDVGGVVGLEEQPAKPLAPRAATTTQDQNRLPMAPSLAPR
jgi:hypothetical protein